MNKFTFIFLFLLVITLVPFVSAGTFDDCAIYGNCQTASIVTALNYSILNVNNSQYLQGLTPAQVAALFDNSGLVPYTGAVSNVDIGNHNLTLNRTFLWSDGVGARDLWQINDVSGDGFKMQYLYNFHVLNDDWLVFNKVDGNDPDPDGGIAFMMTNSTGWNKSIIEIDGYGLANFTNYQVATTSGISSGAVYVKSNGSTTNTTTVTITSAAGNENATILFEETDVQRASIEYSGRFSDLNFWSKYADGAEDIMFSCNTRSNACRFPTGNVSMTYNLYVSGNITGLENTSGKYLVGDGRWITNINTTNSTYASYNDTGLIRNWSGDGIYVPYTGATDDVVLGSHNLTAGGTALFVRYQIGSSRVGIGTTSPSSSTKLHVSVDTSSFFPTISSVTDMLLSDTSTSTDAAIFSIIGGNGTTGTSTINFGDQNDEDAGAISYKHDNNSLNFRINTTADKVIFNDTGIFSNGNVTVAQDVLIAGYLFGGSPVKIAGGLNITSGLIYGNGSQLTDIPVNWVTIANGTLYFSSNPFGFYNSTNTPPASNPFNQVLNTTSNVKFNDINSTGNFTGNIIYGGMKWESSNPDDASQWLVSPVMSTAGVFYNFSNATAGFSLQAPNLNGFSFINGNALVAQVAGLYKFDGTCDYYTKSSSHKEMTLYVNGIATNFTTHRTAPRSQELQPVSVQNVTPMTPMVFASDLLYDDGSGLLFSELSTVGPKLDANFTFQLTYAENPLTVNFGGYYLGSDAHEIYVLAWNYTGSKWVNLSTQSTDIPNSGLVPYTKTWKFPDTNQNEIHDFMNSTYAVKIRIRHQENGGTNTHRLFVDKLTLQRRRTFDRQTITGFARLNVGDTAWVMMAQDFDNALVEVQRFNVNLIRVGN